MTPGGGAWADVQEYLRLSGWTPQPPGPAGVLWTAPSDEQPSLVAVPEGLSEQDLEFQGVIARIAAHEARTPSEVVESIRGLRVDVARLRAANDLVIRGSIPIDAGVELVLSASRMLRACATTAQRPRAQIGGNFSKLADEVVRQARFGHTQEGSYILPVLMPIGESPAAKFEQPELEGLEVDRVAWEPAERRVMRTFAEALGAVSEVIVRPAREPMGSDIPRLVAAGVSREFVRAIHDVVRKPSVYTFDSSFSWAGAVRSPASAPTFVSIPAESAELLEKAERLLSRPSVRVPESITGPVVEVRHLPDDPFGTIAVQTVTNGRPSEVRVTVRALDLDQAHEWMRTARTIHVEGNIIRRPGHPRRIDDPIRVEPLDRQFLPQAGNR